MLKIKINNNEYEFKINDELEIKRLVNTICLAYRNKFPFFINLLISLCDIRDVEENSKDSLAYTKLNTKTERIDIFINFKILEEKQFSHAEILFLFFHELLHNYFYHFLRFEEQIKNGQHELVNVVTDYYINTICDELIGKSIPETLEKKGFKLILYDSICKLCENFKIRGLPNEEILREEWTDMQLFEFILKKLPPSQNGNGKGQNNNSNNSSQGGSGQSILDKVFDDHSKSSGNSDEEKNLTEEEKQAIKEIFKNKIQAKEQELKEQMNSTSYSNEQFVLDRKVKLMKPDYFLNQLKLKRIISKALSKHYIYNYQRMNRKKVVDDLIFKGRAKKNGLKLVVGIDVSGSISYNDLDTIISMLYGFKKKNEEYSFDIIYWSSCDIKKNKTYYDDIKDIREFSKKKVYSSGGTVIETFHEYLNEKYKEPIEVINFTDGYFYYDKKLNKNILKYHFVLTTKIEKDFSSFYSNKVFNIVSILKERIFN